MEQYNKQVQLGPRYEVTNIMQRIVISASDYNRECNLVYKQTAICTTGANVRFFRLIHHNIMII